MLFSFAAHISVTAEYIRGVKCHFLWGCLAAIRSGKYHEPNCYRERGEKWLSGSVMSHYAFIASPETVNWDY